MNWAMRRSRELSCLTMEAGAACTRMRHAFCLPWQRVSHAPKLPTSVLLVQDRLSQRWTRRWVLDSSRAVVVCHIAPGWQDTRSLAASMLPSRPVRARTCSLPLTARLAVHPPESSESLRSKLELRVLKFSSVTAQQWCIASPRRLPFASQISAGHHWSRSHALSGVSPTTARRAAPENVHQEKITRVSSLK